MGLELVLFGVLLDLSKEHRTNGVNRDTMIESMLRTRVDERIGDWK